MSTGVVRLVSLVSVTASCYALPALPATGPWDGHAPHRPLVDPAARDVDGAGEVLIECGWILATEIPAEIPAKSPSDLRHAERGGASDRCAANALAGDPCPGDVTGNGLVNPVDLAALLVDWGTDGYGEFHTDCNRDGIVDADDLAIVLAGWGPCS